MRRQPVRCSESLARPASSGATSALLPAARCTAAVHTSDDLHGGIADAIVEGIRKSRYERPPHVAQDKAMQLGRGDHGLQNAVDLVEKSGSQSGGAPLIPQRGICDILLSKRPDS